MPENIFRYSPLAGVRTIRPFRFVPYERLICQLLHVDIDKACPYIVISYTLGYPEKSFYIGVVVSGEERGETLGVS